MEHLWRLVGCIMIGMLALTSFGQPGEAGDQDLSNDILQRQVIMSDLRPLATTDAFREILWDARVPFGIVQVITCDDQKIMHQWSGSRVSLRDALDLIVVSDPQYEWRIEDGVINILPLEGEPAFLQTRIGEFQVNDPLSLGTIVNQLSHLPEVKKRMAELRLEWGLSNIGLQSLRPKLFTVLCQDVTLREALNATVRAHGTGLWSYTEKRCDGRTTIWLR